MFVMGVSFAGGAGNAQAGIGGVILVGLLLLAGSITAAVGWFGFGKLFGGLHSIAGVFSILIAVTLLLFVFGFVMTSLDMIQIGGLGLLFAIPLTALLGGLGMMGSAGKSANAGIMQAGGIVLLVVGIVGVLMGVFALGRMNVGGLAEILSYVYIFGGTAGFALAGVAMLGNRA
ncbi:MAG: hypothetical protein CVU56_23525 [Deltaproteobacteria bacterium HGW-Deltaproteobacteria-14]|nr:MAG: hypothetical protein CVU56_23525 [Deltaproteobacteria bacterium HGW-Deltaproteobacteria-14]